MTIGSDEKGNLTFHLTPEEAVLFREGRSLVKYSGDSQGDFTVTLALRRPQHHHALGKADDALKAIGHYTYQGHRIEHGRYGYLFITPKNAVVNLPNLDEALKAIDKIIAQ